MPAKNQTIVKAKEIKQRTGWSKEDMRKARKLGWVQMIRNESGIFYILESLNQNFIKQ